jgi:putative ABC transport system permease protein
MESLVDELLDSIESQPEVRAAAALHADEFEFAGTRVPVVAFRDGSNPITRTMLEGRPPEAVDEVALGRNTLDALGLEVGDTVTMSTDSETRSVTVTGIAVLPAVGTYSGSDKTALGEGAIVDVSTVDPSFSFVAVAIEAMPGADLSPLAERLGSPYPGVVPVIHPAGTPAEVDSLEALAVFPRWLTVVLVVLVGIPVVHSLVLSVRGRRRDLAVMAALGATPRTLRRIGLVQGLTVVLAGVVVGIPLGIVLGRWTWAIVAESFGTIVEPIVPAPAVLAIGVGVLLVGALVGGTPVWRTDRFSILRSLRPE